VLPLLVETPAGYIAVSESDLLDWAGMSVTGTGTAAVKVTLDAREDGKGLFYPRRRASAHGRVLDVRTKAAQLARFGSDRQSRDAEPDQGSRVDQAGRKRLGPCGPEPTLRDESRYTA